MCSFVRKNIDKPEVLVFLSKLRLILQPVKCILTYEISSDKEVFDLLGKMRKEV